MTEDNKGLKLSISALLKCLETRDIDVECLWDRIYDLVTRTIVSIDPVVVGAVTTMGLHRNNCFGLFGFDVLIDAHLKPWLLEVNPMPSLATESPLDFYIKSNLISDTLNLVGIQVSDRMTEGVSKTKARIRAKLNQTTAAKAREILSPYKVKILRKELLEEYERRGHFLRIHPMEGTNYYDKFFVVGSQALEHNSLSGAILSR